MDEEGPRDATQPDSPSGHVPTEASEEAVGDSPGETGMDNITDSQKDPPDTQAAGVTEEGDAVAGGEAVGAAEQEHGQTTEPEAPRV